jgi:arylsulfatase
MLLASAMVLAGASGCASLPGAEEGFAGTKSNPPDIILIVLDDVGFADLGSYGSEIATPAIDALAADGLRYNRFETKAVCSPTRASLLTGRNSQTVRMNDLPSRLQQADPTDTSQAKGELPLNAETLATALRAGGYRTAAVGKWHLAPAYDTAAGATKASWPLQRGFDSFYGFIGGWTDQYQPELVEGNQPIPSPTMRDYHLSVDLVNRSIAALKAAEAAGRPSFLYLSFGAAHAPTQVPQSYIDRYRGQYEVGWNAIRQARFARQKELGVVPIDTVLPPPDPGDPDWDTLSPTGRRTFARFMATYAGFITHTDEQIGRLIAHLKATNAYSNTLIVLLSDNGPAPEGGNKGGFRRPYLDPTTLEEMAANLQELGSPTTQPLYQRGWAMAGATPLRRYKLWPQAGGTRAPLIVTWPDRLRQRGAVRPQLVDVIDVAPTILASVGLRFRSNIAGVAQVPVAGHSVAATFRSAKAPGRNTQFFQLRGNRAITHGRWKAVAMHRPGTDFTTDEWHLYDILTDFSETRNLAVVYPERLEELKALWWQEARRYADPPLMEMAPALRQFPIYDDAFRSTGE